MECYTSISTGNPETLYAKCGGERECPANLYHNWKCLDSFLKYV
jgi:hypothetical protein